jgi:hypothetical protein
LLPLIVPDNFKLEGVLASFDGLIVEFVFLIRVEGFLVSSEFLGGGVFSYFGT